MNDIADYEKIVADVHAGKYQVKSIKYASQDAKQILDAYIAGIPEEIDAVVEHAKKQGYTFSELVSLVAQSGVKKGLRLN